MPWQPLSSSATSLLRVVNWALTVLRQEVNWEATTLLRVGGDFLATGSKLGDDCLTGSKLGDDCFTGSKMGDDCLTSSQLGDDCRADAVGCAVLADNRGHGVDCLTTGSKLSYYR